MPISTKTVWSFGLKKRAPGECRRKRIKRRQKARL